MKKIITIIFLSLLISNLCYSQSGWVWQNPLPQGNNLNKVFFVTNQIGYAVGETGTVIKTTDFGENWFLLQTESGLSFHSLYFINDLTGFIVCGRYNDAVIYKTTDGANNWIQNMQINTELWAIYFNNINTGFVTGDYGTVIKTTNSGVNWFDLNTAVNNTLFDINFIDPNTGFCCGSNEVILKTTNTGDSWTICNVGMNTDLNCIYFANVSTGYTCGTNRILKTTNSGINWTLIYTGTTEWFTSIKFVNSNLGYATGGINNYKVFLKTTNGGNNWQTIDFGAKYALRSLFTIDTGTVYVAGWGGTMFKTTTAGLSWNLLMGNKSEFRDIYFQNINEGIAIGYEGAYLITTNGGTNWIPYDIGRTENLNSVYFINSNSGFIVGNNGLLLKSTNSGTNWVPVNLNTNEKLNRIRFCNQIFGIIVGNEKTLFNTTNSGNSWLVCNVPPIINNVFDCYFVDQHTGFIVGDNRPAPYQRGLVYKTTNNCISWSNVLETPIYIKSAYFLDSNIGFVGCDFKNIYRTTNCGQNWQLVMSIPSYQGINDFCFLNHLIGFVAFGHDYGYGGILKTTNGGLNWSELYTNTNNGLYSIVFVNNFTGYTVGQYGTIFKTTNGGGNFVSIKSENKNIPSSPSLSQNYPNPFNPVTRIKYDVPKQSLVRIIIYDVLGREIQTLVNQTQKPGSYEVTWDGSRFASGVYFYKLSVADFVKTKKMVLIK